MTTNKSFCYWLQGFFEIEGATLLNTKQVKKIILQLDSIEEPKGSFTEWLKEVLDLLVLFEFDKEKLLECSPIIAKALNDVFLHVIDQSYVSTIPFCERLKIHQGKYNVFS